jgi:hypothetical protein
MQLALDFEPGLTERYPTLLDCCRAVAYRSAKPMKAIAADMDLSQSDLSRKLSGDPDDPRRLSVQDMERLILSTGDLEPIHYLAAKFCEPLETQQARALGEIAKLMPQMQALMRTLQK